eukprot:6697262-Lingulodinium_polyedra.AAC.1
MGPAVLPGLGEPRARDHAGEADGAARGLGGDEARPDAGQGGLDQRSNRADPAVSGGQLLAVPRPQPGRAGRSCSAGSARRGRSIAGAGPWRFRWSSARVASRGSPAGGRPDAVLATLAVVAALQ